MMQKRTVLTMFAAMPLLAACGFRLRGAPDFSFKSVYIQAAPGSGIGRELTRTLQGAGGDVKVLTNPVEFTKAEAIIEVLSEQRERVVVGLNANGQVRELQLRLRLRFRVKGQQGEEFIAPTMMLQQRDVSYNESIALSKEGEEQMLYKNMQTDLVQQLMRRLATVKMIPVS